MFSSNFRNERAVRSGLEAQPRGVLVQLGLCGDVFDPQNMVLAKEIEMARTFFASRRVRLARRPHQPKRVDLTAPDRRLLDWTEAGHALRDRGRSQSIHEWFTELLKNNRLRTFQIGLDCQLRLNSHHLRTSILWLRVPDGAGEI